MPSPASSARMPCRLAGLSTGWQPAHVRALSALCAVLFALLGLSHPAAAIRQQAHNSRVVLDLPAGFEPAPLFSGFINERLGVSYVILESPHEAYDEIVAGFTPRELAKRGITDPELGTLARTGDHVYMRARQESPAGTYAKFFVAFRTNDQSVLISANVPIDALREGTIQAADIEKVLASAHTAARTAVRELYSLGYLGAFKEAGTLIGTSKVYTLDGRIGPVREGQPHAVFMVAPSLDTRPVENPHEFAKRLLKSLTGYRDIRFDAPEDLMVDRHTGVAIEATAVDGDSGAAVEIFQVLLPAASGGYFRLLGIAPKNLKLLPEFRRMAQEFRLAPAETLQEKIP